MSSIYIIQCNMSVCWCVHAYMYVCIHNYGCYIPLATVTLLYRIRFLATERSGKTCCPKSVSEVGRGRITA